MTPYSLLHCHTDASLLDGLSKPEKLIERAKELELKSVAVTDHGSLSNLVTFSQKAKKAGIKPILGCELYISQQDGNIKNAENRSLEHLVVLAKNKNGWKDLLKLTAKSNNESNFYYKPRLSLKELSEFCQGNLIAFSGHVGSSMANILFDEPKLTYSSSTIEEVGNLLKTNWEEDATNLAKTFLDMFGSNFFMEIQLIDHERLPVCDVISNCLRKIAKKLNIKCIATPDSHYCRKEDAHDQRILLCSALRTNLKEVSVKIRSGEDIQLGGFFKSSNYHIPSTEELLNLHEESEVENTNFLASMCEEYDILNKPIFPNFPCPNNMNSHEYLTELCRLGWKERIEGRIPQDKWPEYVKRIKYELDTIEKANLTDYFLLKTDIIEYARKNGIYTGIARGSVGGTLVGYLTKIHSLDSIKYGLIFERFFNPGRLTASSSNLADIDTDYEINKREQVIKYVENKYGNDKVAHIATFGRLQGRGAITEVLRAHSISFEEIKKITEHIPDEAKISDQLEEQRNDGEEPSIIRWALENNSKDLASWCYIKDDGVFDGPMSRLFEQACRIEGVKKSQGKHASGIIICSEKLEEISPLIYDKSSDKLLVGVDLKSAEALGLVKIDILGTAVLDKLHYISDLVGGNEVEEE